MEWTAVTLTILLLFAVTEKIVAKHITQSCHFNSMCSCKIASISTVGLSNETEDDNQTAVINTSNHLREDNVTSDLQRDNDIASIIKADNHQNVIDVSCVGVPFSFFPGKRHLKPF